MIFSFIGVLFEPHFGQTVFARIIFILSTILVDRHNILLVRMRVYHVRPVKTRTVNYLYAKNLSAFCQIHHLENAHARFPNLLTKIQLLYSPDFIEFYLLRMELVHTDFVSKSYQNT